MNLKKTFLFWLAQFLILPSLFAGITEKDIQNAIDIKKLQHPYLYFTEEQKPAILSRIENDRECNDIMRMLLAEANRLMNTPIDRNVPARDPHPRFWTSGESVRYINFHFTAAQRLAFIYQMTGDKKYAEKAFEFADVICDLQSWTYRAHEFPIIYSRVWPKYVDDDMVVFNFDIRSVYIGHALSAVYDWTYDVLTKRQRDRIRGALMEKVILPVRKNYQYLWDANAFACNHCQLFCSGIGVTSLALLTENPELVDVVAEAYNRMNRVYQELGIDGGWQEGPKYWAYGMNNSIYFLDALNNVTDGTYNLFAHPKIKNNPATFYLYGIDTEFGDVASGPGGTTYQLNKLTEASGDPLCAWYRNTYFGDGKTMFDILWPRSNVQPIEPTVKSKHFRSIDWVIMQSAFNDPEKVSIACKAGMNDDPHHGHLDVGQFIIKWRDQFYIKDVGKAYPYDEKYFDNVRFDYPQVSSAGHNLVFVNGEKQICAKYKDQPWREGVGGKVLEFRTSDSRDYALMDPTNAYEKHHVKNWRRHIILEKPVITLVLDEISAEKGDEIETRFHTACESDLHDQIALLRGEKGAMALIPITQNEYAFRDGKHAFLPVKKDARFQWIPYFGTVTTAQQKKTIIATLILPVESLADAQRIRESVQFQQSKDGSISLSFTDRNEPHIFEFLSKTSGLVLR